MCLQKVSTIKCLLERKDKGQKLDVSLPAFPISSLSHPGKI